MLGVLLGSSRSKSRIQIFIIQLHKAIDYNSVVIFFFANSRRSLCRVCFIKEVIEFAPVFIDSRIDTRFNYHCVTEWRHVGLHIRCVYITFKPDVIIWRYCVYCSIVPQPMTWLDVHRSSSRDTDKRLIQRPNIFRSSKSDE